MAFGNDFIKGFLSGITGPQLKDYQHASKTFIPNAFAYAPKVKFLFHCVFNINTQIPGILQLLGEANTTISKTVKSVQLPSYQFQVEELNQYNRKRYANTKINYNPVQITFHDDNSDLVRQMWYAYYQYYIKDSQYSYNGIPASDGSPGSDPTFAGFSYNASDIYVGERQIGDFGLVGEGRGSPLNTQPGVATNPNFFNDITIFGFNQHNYSAYTLINPMITEFAHDTYDYSAGGQPMQNTMTIKYELVKYYSGALNGATKAGAPPFFGRTEDYDQVTSAITRPGGNATILGKGGLLDAGQGILNDLAAGNPIGAALTAVRASQTFKGKNLKSIAKQEVNQTASQVLSQGVETAIKTQIPAIDRNRTGYFATPPKGNNSGKVPESNTPRISGGN
jgi:hypothetical protein